MRLLILDRDGVINEESDEFIKSAAEWAPLPGAMGAISRANQLGFHVVVVSNQSGLARGKFTIEQLHQIHSRMIAEVMRHGGSINAIFYCPHLPDDGCACRKPGTEMLTSIARRLGVDLKHAVLVGDRLSDINAARAVGALPMLVQTGHGKETLAALESSDDVHVCRDLPHAVDWLRQNLHNAPKH